MSKIEPNRGAARLTELEERCRRFGKPLTVHRRAVLAVLLRRDDHPTADDVYSQVVQQLPTISRATVYRVLEMLVELDLAARVAHPRSATRYDWNTRRHHHLVCDRCGKIRDFEAASMGRLRMPDMSASGFHARDYSVQIRGVCGDCARHPPAS